MRNRPQVNLLFGVHSHQPVGNFASVFKQAVEDCYRPFIDTLYAFAEIKATLHFSGSLIDWLLKNEPGLLQKVNEMLKRNQVEILTGAYYEPILSIIPERDRIGQIEMLSNFIQDYFKYQPSGMWIAERVWEPQLVEPLVRSGVEYILLDDFHFRYIGKGEQDLLGYYFIEEDGGRIAVFPINERLRYSIPFSSPGQSINYLRSLATEEKSLAVTIVDDAEKFGLWPGTHKWVYQEKWLERFFCLLIKNGDWLKTNTLGEYLRQNEALGLCKLASCSYEEMMSWSGGKFKNFFIKYPEANNLHKRMLYVSEQLNKDADVNKEAQRYLYMGQCNCPYWHGVFGGIYLKHLRINAYKNLIYAQSLIKKRDEHSQVELECLDFDQDGADEIIIKNELLYIFLKPTQGGALFELDYIPKSFNLLNVMTRRPEVYHQKIKTKSRQILHFKKEKAINVYDLLGSKEKGLEKFLLYDSYRRLSLVDHFLAPELTLEEFKGLAYEELGDFINGPYSAKHRKEGECIYVTLQREAKLNCSGQQIPLLVSKELCLNNKDAQFSLEYNLQNLSKIPLDVVFAVEFNLAPESEAAPNNLYCKGQKAGRSYSLKQDIEASGIREIRLQDAIGKVAVSFYFDRETNLWSHPVETISASEQGFERNYQQTLILPHWLIKLEKTCQLKITVAIDQF